MTRNGLGIGTSYQRARGGLDRLAVLRGTDLFGNLPDDTLRAIAAASSVRHLSRGEILYSERDEASGLYLVARGELRSVRLNMNGREQVLSTERRGAVLAAVAIFGEGKFFSTMIADTQASVLAIEKRYAHQLCREYPELLWNVARALALKVRLSAELIEILALRHVDQRVAQYLLTICEQRGVGDGTTCVVELTMNRSEIASRLGSAREVVSRAFTQLVKAGLIRLQGRRLVTVPDMRALRVFAGAELEMRETGSLSELPSDAV